MLALKHFINLASDCAVTQWGCPRVRRLRHSFESPTVFPVLAYRVHKKMECAKRVLWINIIEVQLLEEWFPKEPFYKMSFICSLRIMFYTKWLAHAHPRICSSEATVTRSLLLLGRKCYRFNIKYLHSNLYYS